MRASYPVDVVCLSVRYNEEHPDRIETVRFKVLFLNEEHEVSWNDFEDAPLEIGKQGIADLYPWTLKKMDLNWRYAYDEYLKAKFP
jgi:hypothetical protein